MTEDKKVVRFSDSSLRPLMRKLAEVYFTAKRAVAEYDATGIAAAIPGGFDDFIVDGSPNDGRPQISCGGVKLAMENVRLFLKQVEETEANGLSLIAGAMAISPSYSVE